jgi:Ser/Thr protein kinase RdoA (MazF antagonist)
LRNGGINVAIRTDYLTILAPDLTCKSRRYNDLNLFPGAQMNAIQHIAEEFVRYGQIIAVRKHGNGNINDTFLVIVENAGREQFVLQRINTYVFTHPHLIIDNLQTYVDHVEHRLKADSAIPDRRWDIPRIRATNSGNDYYIDEQGNFWRAISFVDHAQTYDTAQSMEHAREVGFALGYFHSLVSDLHVNTMHDTLEGFHIVPTYLQKYDQVRTKTQKGNHSPEIRYCHRFIAERRNWATVLEEAKNAGHLSMRIIHGDPKINNIMICNETGQAVSIIDLDTVKPGLVHYDIGDCLRSSCNPLGEDTLDLKNICFETDLARAILDGYISVAQYFLTENDFAYIYPAIRLLAFETGLRFFQDYLAGNVYFKVRHPEHNLERAIVQFKLTESIEAQEKLIRKIIADFQPSFV